MLAQRVRRILDSSNTLPCQHTVEMKSRTTENLSQDGRQMEGTEHNKLLEKTKELEIDAGV